MFELLWAPELFCCELRRKTAWLHADESKKEEKRSRIIEI